MFCCIRKCIFLLLSGTLLWGVYSSNMHPSTTMYIHSLIHTSLHHASVDNPSITDSHAHRTICFFFQPKWCVCVCVRVCVRACVRACRRACVHACKRVCKTTSIKYIRFSLTRTCLKNTACTSLSQPVYIQVRQRGYLCVYI